MEKTVKPENLFIRRNRGLTALAMAICLIFAAALPFTVLIIKDNTQYGTSFLILFAVIAGIFSFILLVIALLNLRNLFFPYLLTSDENGIRDFSGYVHSGFVNWKDISQIYGATNSGAVKGAEAKVVKILNFIDGEPQKIVIKLKDFKQFKRSLPVIKRALYIFGSYVSIPLQCSTCKSDELLSLLNERLNYYGNND